MENVMDSFLAHMSSKNIDVTSAVAILKEAYELAKKEPNPTEAVETTLRRLAAGRDGHSGTTDDLLPKETVDHLVVLLKTGMAAEFVEVFTKKRWCCFL
jgi:hypothetical protein